TKGETIESSHSVTCSLIKEACQEKVAVEATDSSEKAEPSESDATPVKEMSTPDPDDKENVETTTSPEAAVNAEETKKNYFIKLSSGSSRDSGFGVFGKFSPSSLRILDQGNQKQTAAENYFLQFAPNTSNESTEENTENPKSVSGSGSSFVFGQNLTDRVTVS
ncbi:uncharacterized protein LOC117120033, partial [Anneissia japonica]|uniref:uncharacterized protein LOC117120033 n=1 Tax=Anneissia japonica TaxID=1529436 RepID=UPI001425AF5D